MEAELIKSFNELFDSFEYFKKNLKKAREKHEIELEVHRFEFIIDSFLKNIKMYLNERSYNYVYPADCIKAAAKFGMLVSENIFLEMLDDKYRISNLKNQKIPEEIYQRIKVRYPIILGRSFEKIKKNYLPGKSEIVKNKRK